MSATMSTAISEAIGAGQVPEPPDMMPAKVAFSYCCECGTYDAHTTACTCCGFDFRVGASDRDVQ